MANESSTFKSLFRNIPIPPGSSCCTGVAEFSAWVRQLALLCSNFGTALKPVQNDMEQNIKKLNKAANKHNEADIEALLNKEKASGEDKKDPSGTVGVLWLQRGIEFLLEFFHIFLATPSGETSGMMQSAYERTLKRHHPWITQKTFKAISHLLPSRNSFLKVLGHGQATEQQTLYEMGQFLLAYQQPMSQLTLLLLRLGIESPRSPVDPLPDVKTLVPSSPPEESVSTDK
ncbi:hypothetical protein AAHC03_024 [Spirometra sp. Aus1]